MAGCLQEMVLWYWCPAALVCLYVCMFYFTCFLLLFFFSFFISQPLRPYTHTLAYSRHVCVYISSVQVPFFYILLLFFCYYIYKSMQVVFPLPHAHWENGKTVLIAFRLFVHLAPHRNSKFRRELISFGFLSNFPKSDPHTHSYIHLFFLLFLST